MKKKQDLFMAIFCGVFLTVGLCMLMGGVIILVNGLRFRETAVEVSAEITDIEYYRRSDGELDHQVLVKYTFDGKVYEDVDLHYYDSSLYTGKMISVYCDPKEPGYIKTSGSIFLLAGILGFMGIIFTAIAAAFLVAAGKKISRRKKVMKSGKVLYAAVDSIEKNSSYTRNGRHPYNVFCVYRDEYRDIIYRFKSDVIWTDPGLVLHSGDVIPVYVEESDYSNYYVDLKAVIEGKIVDYT